MPECRSDLPNLSVGDMHLTDDNYFKFKKKNFMYVVGVSSAECETCCALEPLLNELHDLVKDKSYAYETGKKQKKK